MTTIKFEFCRDRRRACRRLGEVIRDHYYTENIDTLLARIREEIRRKLEHAVSQIAVVTQAAPEPTSGLGMESATGTHLTAAIATIEAPLPEDRIRWAAEAVATSNRLYVRPRRVSSFVSKAQLQRV